MQRPTARERLRLPVEKRLLQSLLSLLSVGVVTFDETRNISHGSAEKQRGINSNAIDEGSASEGKPVPARHMLSNDHGTQPEHPR